MPLLGIATVIAIYTCNGERPLQAPPDPPCAHQEETILPLPELMSLTSCMQWVTFSLPMISASLPFQGKWVTHVRCLNGTPT